MARVVFTITIDSDGMALADYPHTAGERLVAGQYTAEIEVGTRVASLGEVARDQYGAAMDFEEVAAAVVAVHEARKG